METASKHRKQHCTSISRSACRVWRQTPVGVTCRTLTIYPKITPKTLRERARRKKALSQACVASMVQTTEVILDLTSACKHTYTHMQTHAQMHIYTHTHIPAHTHTVAATETRTVGQDFPMLEQSTIPPTR